MLDFSKLKTPAASGDVLVVPEPSSLVAAARSNHADLGTTPAPLLDSTLAKCRRRTREHIIGRDDTLVIVTGHHPAFIHPGVWAKHIVATRLAAAIGGTALNLVVDQDAPKNTSLEVPTLLGGGAVLRSVPFGEVSAGCAFEQLAAATPQETKRIRERVQEVMGDRYEASQMPTFFRGFEAAGDSGGWVDQAVAGRRAVEASFSIEVDDRRVSRLWRGPLLLDMLANAERFAESYNSALEWYRREFRVRGAQRPIPDLHVDLRRCELPVWAYRNHEPRRRLFVARCGQVLQLFAAEEKIGEIPLSEIESADKSQGVLSRIAGWHLRPRALALTIWARLLLADLFIHGIGGAKYDRISDVLIADYYGISPPKMACVSATLHLGPTQSAATSDTLNERLHAQRDLHFNPQRNLPVGEDIQPLIAQRAAAVRRSRELRDSDRRNRALRRQAFAEIRELNRVILALRPGAVEAAAGKVASARRTMGHDRIAGGREYFFGLFPRGGLELLLDALPCERDFRLLL